MLWNWRIKSRLLASLKFNKDEMKPKHTFKKCFCSLSQLYVKFSYIPCIFFDKVIAVIIRKCLTWSIWLIAKAELLVARRVLYMSDVMSLLAMEWAHGVAYCVLHLQAIYTRTTFSFFFVCMSNLFRNLCIFTTHEDYEHELFIV